MKIYSSTYEKNKECFSFWFSFDGWSTDNCIVYDIKNPTRWACNNGYPIGGKKYNAIQKAINKIIKN